MRPWRKMALGTRVVLSILVLGLSACEEDSSSAPAIPEFEISSPTSNDTCATSQSTVDVGGSQSWPLATVAVTNQTTGQTGSATVNRVDTPCPIGCLWTGVVTKYHWRFTVTLVPGDNRIQVSATDYSGGLGSDAITIRFALSVVRAAATAGNKVTVWFSAPIDATSVNPNGSQFSFSGGLTAISASVGTTTVTVGTTIQTSGAMYTITAANSVIDDTYGLGVYPLAASATFPGLLAPFAPTNAWASAGDGQVILSWDPVAEAASYTLYRATVPGLTQDNYASLQGGTRMLGVATPHLDTGRLNGTAYYYVVTGSNATGEGPDSAEVSATSSSGATSALTGDPTSIRRTSARLNGSLINPVGYTTNVWFEYGTTPAYGLVTSQVPYSESGPILVSADLSALQGLASYYYRIVTQNSAGTFYGQREAFYIFSFW